MCKNFTNNIAPFFLMGPAKITFIWNDKPKVVFQDKKSELVSILKNSFGEIATNSFKMPNVPKYNFLAIYCYGPQPSFLQDDLSK